MAESKEAQNDIAYIRTHVDNLERMVRFQIAANPQSAAIVAKRFTEREGMAEVYLALSDEPKTQEELTALVKRSQPTVSRVCAELLKAGLVRTIPSVKDRRKQAYTWSDVEDMLGVSAIAREYLAKLQKQKAKKGKSNATDSDKPQSKRKLRVASAPDASGTESK